jgi:hypothetical protein
LANNFLYFSYLHLVSAAFSSLHWKGSKKGVFGGIRPVGGGTLMGHKGQIGHGAASHNQRGI